jgi:hypothetical protein
MSDNVIESYLVSLGFKTDQSQLLKFQGSLKAAEGFVTSSTGGIVADFLKFEATGIAAFTAVGFGAIGFIEKLAMTDQQMRLFGMRSFMTTQQARAVQTSLDVLGASLDDVAWDKELHARFKTLIDDQKQLSAMLGPQYEKQMMDVRDVWFQLQRLEVKGEYFGMKFAGDLLKKLGFGDGDILNSLMKLNDFVLKNMPQWSDELSDDLVPILHDFWDILKDIGGVAEEVGLEFTNLVGVFSGDDSIEGSTFDFKKFADALKIVADFLKTIVEDMLKVEKVAVRFAPVIAGIVGGGSVGTGIGAMAGIEGGPLGMLAGGMTGGTIGSIVGGIGGLVTMGAEESGRYGAGSAGSSSTSGGSIAEQARLAAKKISERTRIPADLIFGQMAFETGNFTSRQTGQNNLSGIKYPGTDTFRSFNSVDDFADTYAKVLTSPRYVKNGVLDAKNGQQFAHALKTPTGTYYGTGSESGYAGGVERYRRAYDSGPAQISVGSIPITITHPGATHEQIQVAVTNGVRDGLGQQTQTNMTNVAGIYQ